MKIQVKTTTVKTKQVEIEFPYYTKDLCHYYKVVNEKTIIQVTETDYLPSICFSYLDHALKYKKTTESQFNKAYNKVLSKISKYI